MGVSFGNKPAVKQVQEQVEQQLQEAQEQITTAQDQVQVAQSKLDKLTSQQCGTATAGNVTIQLTLQQTTAVTELALLKRTLDETKPAEKSAEDHRKSLLEIANSSGFPTDQPVVFATHLGEVIFKPNSEKREVTDMHGLIGALKAKLGGGEEGYKKLLEFLKINVGDVDKILTPLESAKYISKVEGPRVLGSTKVIE